MRRVLAAALVALAAAGPALAQGGANVQVGRARIGYLEELDPGWLPVSFPLENVGDAPSTVQLVARAQKGAVAVWTSERSVTLPPKTRRVETLYVRLSSDVQTIEALVQGEKTTLHSQSKGTTWRPQAGGRRGEGLVPVHALVVREGPSERALSTWLEPPAGSPANPNVSTPPPVSLSATQVEPRELPDRPEGYDGIDVVLLSKTSARSFDEARRRALLSWLRDGGRVILLPGADAGWFRDDLVKALLPADAVVGETTARLDSLAKLAGRSAQAVPSARLYTVAASRHGVRVGSEVVAGKRVPYFTMFKHGAGDVVFAAFDLETAPFAGWGKGAMELGRLLHAAVEPAPHRRTGDDERLAPWFERALVEGELPTPLYLIPVVLVYVLCMGPLNQRLVRRASTPVVSVFTIPLIAFVFTVVCFFAGYIVRGTSTSLDRLAVIEARPGDELGRAYAGLRIRSASSTSYAVRADAQLVASQRGWNEGDKKEGRVDAARVIQDEGRFAFPELPLNLWERAFFQAHGPFVLGGAVTIETTPRSATIRNGTRLSLGPGVLFLPGTEGFRVPPLAPGAEARLDGSMAASVKAEAAELLAAIAESDAQLKVATSAFDNFARHLRVETTYIAAVKNAPPALELGSGSKPDRDLAVLVVEADDQARDEQVYRWAKSVADARWLEDYDDAVAVLSAIPPSSRWHRDAVVLKAFIATAKHVDAAQEAFDAGDYEKARAMVLDVLKLPELERDAVREIRTRLERWTTVATEVEDGVQAPHLTLAERHFRAAADKEPSDNAWKRFAMARVEQIAGLRRMDATAAREHGLAAATDGDAGTALLSFRHARSRDSRLKLREVHAVVSDAAKAHDWDFPEDAPRPTALRRAELLEVALLLRDFLPADDPRREAALRWLAAHERPGGIQEKNEKERRER